MSAPKARREACPARSYLRALIEEHERPPQPEIAAYLKDTDEAEKTARALTNLRGRGEPLTPPSSTLLLLG